MKKFISAVAFATVAGGAWAQVPELGDVLGELSTTELDAFNDSLAGEDTIMLDDFEGSLNIAIVDQALEQGFITADEAADVEAALGIIEDNAEFFDFDLLALVEELLSEGVVTTDELYTTLDLFNQLSVADKTIVGQESFNPVNAIAPDLPSLGDYNNDDTDAGYVAALGIALDRNQYSATLSQQTGLSADGLQTITSAGAFSVSSYESELDQIHAATVTQAFDACGGTCANAAAIQSAYNALPTP